MTTEKRLLRSRDALLGGVCAGVADYFSVDPLVVRILAVVFLLSSAGLLVVPYGVLWALLPLEPKEAAPLDVEPQAVHSETYGAVDVEASRKRDQATPRGASPAQAAGWRYTHPSYTSAAHVPPEPPAGAQRQQPVTPPSWAAAPQHPHPHVHPQPHPHAQPQPPVGAPAPDAARVQGAPHASQPAEPSAAGVKAALWAGSLLLFFGVTAMIASMVEGASWWQYWPLIFVILGIVRMVVPGVEGHRMRKFVDGLIVFCCGSTLMAMSLGAVGWQSIELMLVNLWPLLLVVGGLLLLGGALKSPLITLLAGLCFVAFCVVGLVWYSEPGTTEELVLSAPYGREYHFDMHPWDTERGASASVVTIVVP